MTLQYEESNFKFSALWISEGIGDKLSPHLKKYPIAKLNDQYNASTSKQQTNPRRTYPHILSSHTPLRQWPFPWSNSDCASSHSSLIGWHCFWRGHWRAGRRDKDWDIYLRQSYNYSLSTMNSTTLIPKKMGGSEKTKQNALVCKSFDLYSIKYRDKI